MSLEGLPDFDATLATAPLSPILGTPGEFGVMPTRLSIAAAGGSIDMSLDIFRGNQPGTGTAMLALAISVDYDTAKPARPRPVSRTRRQRSGLWPGLTARYG